MPITTRKPAPPTGLQKFRTVTEGYLMREAQKEMLRKYAPDGAAPAAKKGLVYRLLPVFFKPGFRMTPWSVKRRLLSKFFVHTPQQEWPDKPWEQT